jgi:hypothetical protein
VALVAGCRIGGEAPRVPADQRGAIESAFAHDAQRLSLPGTGCFNVTRPVAPQTRRAYALLVRVAGDDPDAVLPSGDSSDQSPTVRQALAARARVIDTCITRYPEANPAWGALSRGIWAALAEMEG